MPDFVLRSALKGFALTGIFLACAEIAKEAFKLSWRIITLEEDETWEPVVKEMALCEDCRGDLLEK